MRIVLDGRRGGDLGYGPQGLEIGVTGFKHDPTATDERPTQVYIEVYKGKLCVRVWDGSSEDANHVIQIEPLEATTEPERKRYTIAWEYIENSQAFETNALLTEAEATELKAELDGYSKEITDVQVFEPRVDWEVHATLTDVREEIHKALKYARYCS